MPQQEIEVILVRQLASYLAMPIFIVDPAGTLLYYNEPAESILGRRFEETGPMAMAEWSTIFEPLNDAGEPILPRELPLAIALAERRPTHRRFWIEISTQCNVTSKSPAYP
jgi:PAS domain-containing protein